MTYDDLPPEVLRVARNFIRGVFYNQEADRPYDEELLAKNVACHVLQAAAWTPDASHREQYEATSAIQLEAMRKVRVRLTQLETALGTIVLQACNASTAPDSTLRTMLSNVAETARSALHPQTDSDGDD